MTIIRLAASVGFNATTLLSSANMLLAKTFPLVPGSDDWTLTQANGSPFTSIGRIPLNLLGMALTKRYYYLDAARLQAFVVGTNNWTVTPAVPVGANAQAIGPTRATNPTLDPIVTNLEFTKDEEIVIAASGGAAGVYEAILQLHPLQMDPLAGEMVANGTLSPQSPTPTTSSSSSGLILSPTVLGAAGTLSLGQIQLYDGSAPAFPITVPIGAVNDRFGTKNNTAGVNNVTITPGGGQTIQHPVTNAIAATAVLATANLYAEWICTSAGVWLSVG